MRALFDKTSITYLLIIISLTFSINGISQTDVRTEIRIPDIPGYRTLKCDFHSHTVFSDGDVWPPLRVEEAWREGLDAIAITDHIEYLPHQEDIPAKHNRPYELAKSLAEKLDIILIKGAEITRAMPPGHINAIFLEDIESLNTEKWEDAIKAAIEQDAFIFWNHPGWRQPEEKPIWYPEHTVLYDNDWLHGIEIVNTRSYYPLAHQWGIEKQLTMIGNSDIHHPTAMDYEFHKGEHRPLTLVLVKERDISAIKEALFLRRTVVYAGNSLIGEEQFLCPIFEESIETLKNDITIHGKSHVAIPIRNNSDISFRLIPDGEIENLQVEEVTLYAHQITMISISGNSTGVEGSDMISLPFQVENLLTAPDKRLAVEININVHFIPVE